MWMRSAESAAYHKSSSSRRVVVPRIYVAMVLVRSNPTPDAAHSILRQATHSRWVPRSPVQAAHAAASTRSS